MRRSIWNVIGKKDRAKFFCETEEPADRTKKISGKGRRNYEKKKMEQTAF